MALLPPSFNKGGLGWILINKSPLISPFSKGGKPSFYCAVAETTIEGALSPAAPTAVTM